jgi:hypothetical protein
MKPKFIRGTAREDANTAPGYVSSGEGAWSRHQANGPGINLTGGKRTDGRLIRETERNLQKLAKRIETARDPERLSKYRKDFQIKSAFLRRLQEADDRTKIDERIEPVETIYGADEFEKWDNVK